MILAHGIGGRLDLPVPPSYFIAGAGIVVVLSFVALTVLWPTPRLQTPLPGEASSAPRSLLAVLRFAGIALPLLVVAAGAVRMLGLDAGSTRPTIAPVAVWVVAWLAVPFSAALAGSWYRAVSPYAVISRFLGRGQDDSHREPWPAVVALMAFAWLELVGPAGSVTALGVAATVYTVAVVAMGPGSSDFLLVWNGLVGAISPYSWDVKGRRHRVGWLRGLPALPASTAITVFVLASIGTVTFDGLSGTEVYRQALGSAADSDVVATFVLLGMVAAVGLLYLVACLAASRLVSERPSVLSVVNRFAHTLVPIALAYAVAHYFTLIIFEGQQIVAALSDPLGLGWDIFGTADRRIDFFIRTAEPVWYVQLAAIIGGHVIGVVLAHDRALADFGDDAVRSQYAMLLLMVVLTTLGLVILST